MHHVGVVQSGKDVAGAAHVGGELIDFVDAIDDIGNEVWIAQVAYNELVGRRGGKVMNLEVDGANPVPFRFQTLDQVSADEPTGTVDEDSLHSHSLPQGVPKQPV